jgi:hypothetical protein
MLSDETRDNKTYIMGRNTIKLMVFESTVGRRIFGTKRRKEATQ